MRKLLITLALAGALCVPSAVFAEASWYGSLRGGVTVGGGDDARFMDGGSRWGIKGSHDLGDGLSALYRFEHKFSTENAGQAGGRLAYVGLSGGFGTLTLGQVWSASYNSTGAITDNSLLWGDAATSYRVGSALSYAISAGSLSMQIDAVMDGGANAGKAVNQLEFGLTVDLGDIGKVAFAHVSKEDTLTTEATYAVGDDAVEMISVLVAGNDTTNLTSDEINSTGLGAITGLNGVYRITSAADCTAAEATEDEADDCVMKTAYVGTTVTAASGGAVTTTLTYYNEDSAGFMATPAGSVASNGSKSNHVAAQFGFGGVTLHLGQSDTKTKGTGAKTKVTHYGVAGSVGDTGLNYLLQARKVKSGGASSDPWLLSMNKSLGDGATAFIEHANSDDGNSGKTWVGLKVDF